MKCIFFFKIDYLSIGLQYNKSLHLNELKTKYRCYCHSLQKKKQFTYGQNPYVRAEIRR